jgi:hypothetical protein
MQNNRADQQRNVPRPGESIKPREPVQDNRQPENNRPSEAYNNENRNVPRPSGGGDNRNYSNQGHPLVRQAPAPQPRPQVDQNEANKFRTWQQQRPPENRSNASRPPESHPPQGQKSDHKK